MLATLPKRAMRRRRPQRGAGLEHDGLRQFPAVASTRRSAPAGRRNAGLRRFSVATRFDRESGQRRAVARWDRWKLDGQGEPTNYERLAAREFRYDDPQARYLSRPIDPSGIGASGSLTVTGIQDWTDYLGVNPWADFTVPSGGGTPTMATRFLGTLG